MSSTTRATTMRTSWQSRRTTSHRQHTSTSDRAADRDAVQQQQQRAFIQRALCTLQLLVRPPLTPRFALCRVCGWCSEPELELETLRSLARPAAAEFVGSALFIFVACGAGMTTVKYTFVGSTTIGIALSFGMTITVLAYSIGHISGGHLNFAVTFTLALLKRISVMRAVFYFLAQLLGGLVGIGFLKLITPLSWWSSCFAAQSIQSELTVGHAFITEFILTFFLMFVVMAACDSNKSNQTLVPLAIGLAVFCAHMIGLPIDGCSINPTRSFASSAAASGVSGCSAWDNHWVFWFGPLMGAAVAGFVYEYCFHEGGGKVDRLIDQYVLRKDQRQ